MTFEEMKQIKHCIYVYTDMRNDMQYIGLTNNLSRRDGEHIACRGKTMFENIYHAHPDCFKLEVILEFAECANIKDIKNTAEIYYIAAWNTKWPNGYNLDDGGYGGTHERTEELNLKMSENRKLFWNSEDGAKLKKKYSENRKGEGNPMYGTHLTDEQKEHLRLINSGENNAQYGKRGVESSTYGRTGKQNGNSKPCRCIELNITFESTLLAAAWLRENGWPKADGTNIRKCCRGEASKAYGYHWEFIED